MPKQQHSITGPAPTTCHPDWVAVSSDLRSLVPAMAAGRTDVDVVASPGAGHGAPGCHLPEHKLIELDAQWCFDGLDPATIRATDPVDHLRYPVAIGVLAHETAHVVHTRWAKDAAWPGLMVTAAMMLEDVRIEALHIRRRPWDRVWLRAASHHIDVAGLSSAPLSRYGLQAVWRAASAACLVLGRVDAGILDGTDPGLIAARHCLSKALTKRLLAQLHTIWKKAMRVRDTDTDGMRELAKRWCRLLLSRAVKTMAMGKNKQAQLAAATAQAAGVLAEVSAQVVADAQAIAAQATSPPSLPGGAGNASAFTPGADVFATMAPGTTRPATVEEVSAAQRLGQALSQAAQRPREVVKTGAHVPPGRLRMRGVLAAKAQRAAGGIVTATAWQRTMRKKPPQPRLRIGIACDISGSMSMFIDPVGTCAYLLARSVARVDGVVAAATFGEHARGLIPVGTTPSAIPIPDCEHATDHADHAIAGLSEVLDLDANDGHARLLFLITDGGLAPRQVASVAAACKALRDTGCAVIQIGPRNSRRLQHAEVTLLDDPVKAIGLITNTVTKALRSGATTGR
ncbi:MAG: hypothetical protein ACRD0P_08435 [Stackebrandtia sp.]